MFGPEIVPTEAVIKHMSKDQSEGNNQFRFDANRKNHVIWV